MESTAAAVMLLVVVLWVLVGRTRRWLPYMHPKGFRGFGFRGWGFGIQGLGLSDLGRCWLIRLIHGECAAQLISAPLLADAEPDSLVLPNRHR